MLSESSSLTITPREVPGLFYFKQFSLVWVHIHKNVASNPGGNTPHDTNYTATCLPSRKLYKLDEPDMQDTSGEAGTNSEVMYSNGSPHMAE